MNVDFTMNLLKSTPGTPNINNLQVGDEIWYTYEVTPSRVDSTDHYQLVFGKEKESFHQKLGKDYEISVSRFIPEDGEADIDWVQANNEPTELFLKKGYIKVKILKPGFFQNDFSVKLSTKEGESVFSKKNKIAFNAVKIIAYRYTVKIEDSSAFKHSQWEGHHKLYIDTGNYQYDRYLEGFTGTSYHSLGAYPFEKSTLKTYDFFRTQSFEGGSNTYRGIKSIDKLVFRAEVNDKIVIVTYANIPVRDMGERHHWGREGNPNWGEEN